MGTAAIVEGFSGDNLVMQRVCKDCMRVKYTCIYVYDYLDPKGK